GYVVGRVLAPPSPPTVVGPGAPHWPEHVAAHDPGADVLEAARGEVVVDAFSADLVTDQRSGEVGGHFLERLRAADPLVQRHPSPAHRVGQILVGTSAVTTLDPQYADACAHLSWTYWMEWVFGWSTAPQTLEHALALAQQAVALDDSLPAAHLI